MPPASADAAPLREAAARAREHLAIGDAPPELALVLGSGLGALAEEADDARTLETTELPGYPRSTVEGHAGRLVYGLLEGRPVLFVQGRAHLYEGHTPRELTFPVRLAHALGALRLLLTNAAGGIAERLPPGSLMLITDHLNFAFPGPLVQTNADAPNDALLTGSSPYDPDWTDRAEALANELGIALERGVYVWTRGPSYETPAEIRMFSQLGADAVGMSTVPEALAAARLGMPVLGLSTITNRAAGLSAGALDHEEVLDVSAQVQGTLRRLVREIVCAGAS
ncbi:MAG: purine-nucleoside phosphorylase [Bacteroidetes bacterium QH_8_67_23]|nr:MAG: purine-nucleoside phosphorylase [Bacteroidetes bacterium QH_8_67_23]